MRQSFAAGGKNGQTRALGLPPGQALGLLSSMLILGTAATTR
jgi:hypothetical protein